MKTWDEVKQDGSGHYKHGLTEPIDLYKDVPYHGDLLAVQIFALCNIIKYAYRCLTRGTSESDLNKIIHYAEIAGAASKTERG